MSIVKTEKYNSLLYLQNKMPDIKVNLGLETLVLIITTY